MKLFLDDRLPAPKDWERVQTVKECITVLKSGMVEELSLDHDLGEPMDKKGHEPTGYDVATWIEAQAARGNWMVVPTRIACHSGNVCGRQRIETAIDSINKMRKVK